MIIRSLAVAALIMAIAVPAVYLTAGGDETVEMTESIAPEPAEEHSAASAYRWVRAVAAGKGDWPEKAKENQWPLTIVPVVAFDKLWLVGHGKASNFVWHSDDGINWQRSRSNAGWGERYAATRVYFDNKLWAMGGATGTWGYKNDVWSSTDGKDWRLVSEAAGWRPRRGHATVVFKDRMWVIGGAANVGPGEKDIALRNDVWSSSDGVNWTEVTASAPWPARGDHIVLVFQDKLWVLGGRYDQKTHFEDAWYSTDGKTWVNAVEKAKWMGRYCAGGQVFDGKMWVFGGSRKRDVWYSGDGISWTRAAENAPWSRSCSQCGRCGNYSVIFKDKVWIYGGKNEQTGFAQDVWHMSSIEH